MEKNKLVTLPNGLRLMIVPLAGLNSVTVEVFVKIGSKYEERRVFGISHFLEHMAFKGTTKRPDANQLHKEMDSKGASHNAGTGLEVTSYYIKTIEENVPWAIELLADILLNPTLPKEEVAKESGVIAEEIRMYEDNPTMGLGSDFMEMMYRDVGVGCWNIAGKVDGVMRISRDDLVDYRNKYLNSKEMVVVIAGNVTNAKKVIDEVTAAFSAFLPNSQKLPTVKMMVSSKKKLIKQKQIEQAHFCLGVPSISWRDERKHAARLVDIMLCGNSSSRIINEIRERNGLAYYVFPISETLEEGGLTGVQEGVKKDKLQFAIDKTLNEYLTFGDTVTAEELQRAKDYLTGKAKLNMDKTDFWTSFAGQRLLLDNSTEGLDEEITKYNRVTLSQIKDFAKEFFVKSKFKVLSVSA